MSSQRTYTEEEKMNYVAEFKASGMSVNEYAKRSGYARNTILIKNAKFCKKNS